MNYIVTYLLNTETKLPLKNLIHLIKWNKIYLIHLFYYGILNYLW